MESTGLLENPVTKPIDPDDENLNQELKKGSYGKVVLISSPLADKTPRKNGISSRLRSLIRGKQEPPINQERFNLAKLASRVINSGEISEADIKNLPQGTSDTERIKLANVLATLNKFYSQKKFDAERVNRSQLPYELGLILSDFIEILPDNLAARILIVASNPDISRRIAMGEGTISELEANDSQQAAVEAVVLLPQEKREEMFREMQKIEPGIDGGAYRFFAFIAGQWPNRFADQNGQKLIELNLPPDQADAKIKEVASDLPKLGSILRS